jgi:hypothetical protein
MVWNAYFKFYYLLFKDINGGGRGGEFKGISQSFDFLVVYAKQMQPFFTTTPKMQKKNVWRSL